MTDTLKNTYQFSGIIHIHSTYSDGSLSIPEIAGIANELDLNFLLFTDHNTLQPKFDGLEGWYDKILVGIGCELNDASDLNHYLAFDIDEEVSSELPPQEYIGRVKKQGGFGIIAHPDEKRSAMPEYPPYPWKVWESDAFDGIEIWNQMSEWMEGLTPRNKYWRAMHPRKSILGPTSETLGKWDKINMTRNVVGIGGVDAHAHIYKLWGFIRYRIFRYKVIFKTIRTHVLLEEPISPENDYQSALQSIYNALKKARCFISNYDVGDATGFSAWIDNAHQKAGMGEAISYVENTTQLHVRLPGKATVRLIHNGSTIGKVTDNEIAFPLKAPGIYRLEVFRGKRPWIYTNHFRVINNNEKSDK